MDERNFETQVVQSAGDVIQFYDLYADTWDERFGDFLSSELFHKQRLNSFLETLKHAKERKAALELGVGTGVYIEEVAKCFESLIAVDGSANMIQALNNKIQTRHIKNVKTFKSAAENMSFIERSSIDVVYFLGLLEHIVNTDEFFEELHRILKKDGSVVGLIANGNSPWYKLRKLVRGTDKHCSTDKYYNGKELRELLKANQFQVDIINYFGTVPAGTQNDNLAKLLYKIESPLKKLPLRTLLGGITFLAKKA